MALALADLAASSGSVDLRRYESWLVRGPRVTLPGLWAGARVSADVRVRPLRPGGGATLKAGGAPARLAPGGQGPQAVRVEGLADLDGRLMLRALQRGSVSLGRVAFRQDASRRVPLVRLLHYGLLVGLAYAWGVLIGGAAGGRGAAAAATLLTSGALVAGFRVQTLVFLPWALLLLATTVLMAWTARRAGLPRPATAFVTAVFLARTAVALQPGFPSIDAGFHSENLQRFHAGEVIRSTAPGPGGVDVAVPYPPALYALLGPLAAVGWPTPPVPGAPGRGAAGRDPAAPALPPRARRRRLRNRRCPCGLFLARGSQRMPWGNGRRCCSSSASSAMPAPWSSRGSSPWCSSPTWGLG